MTCGIERLFMTLPDYSFTLSISFYQWLLLNTLAIHHRCHKTYHKTILVTMIVSMFPCIWLRRTGHWSLVTDDGGWCLAWSLAPSDDYQSSLLALGLSRPQPPTINPVPGPRMRSKYFPHCWELWVVTYNDGTGPGLGLVRARQSPEYWSDLGGGGGCHQTSFILACITGCIHSDQNVHEINYMGNMQHIYFVSNIN